MGSITDNCIVVFCPATYFSFQRERTLAVCKIFLLEGLILLDSVVVTCFACEPSL